MKGKLNKIFATTALATALVVSSIIPTFAEEDVTVIDTEGAASTDVKIGVTTDISKVASVSVTVPTVLSMVVVADNDYESPFTLIGSNATSGVSADSFDDANKNSGSIVFKNDSTDGDGNPIPVLITTAEVNVNGDNWTLTSEEPSSKYEMKLTLDEQVVGEDQGTLTKGSSDTLNLNFKLDQATTKGTPKSTSMDVTANVGGETTDYSDSTAAKAYTVQWTITTDTSSVDS